LFFALQGKQEWLDLKNGWPEYIDELDRMFSGVAMMGETSFVPG
jgi:cell division protein FtsB